MRLAVGGRGAPIDFKPPIGPDARHLDCEGRAFGHLVLHGAETYLRVEMGGELTHAHVARVQPVGQVAVGHERLATHEVHVRVARPLTCRDSSLDLRACRIGHYGGGTRARDAFAPRECGGDRHDRNRRLHAAHPREQLRVRSRDIRVPACIPFARTHGDRNEISTQPSDRLAILGLHERACEPKVESDPPVALRKQRRVPFLRAPAERRCVAIGDPAWRTRTQRP